MVASIPVDGEMVMGLTTINGLPAHALLVHVIVMLVPLAALLVVLAAAWPAAQRRFGLITPLVAAAALVAVPVTTNAGEWLEQHVTPSPLISAHAELGDELLPWVIGLFVVAVAVWTVHYRTSRSALASERAAARSTVSVTVDAGDAHGAATEAPAPGSDPAGGAEVPSVRWSWSRLIGLVLLMLALVTGIGSVVEVYRIGESGARAVWQDSFSANSAPDTEHQEQSH